jgi:hydrophobic/amphiphilic exporter-1 (mainly G- bacteria), HAE1 family
MKSVYSSPFRLFIVVCLLGLIGAMAGSRLPISLFPNSTKPTIWVGMNYGTYNAEEFVALYGARVEGALRGLSTPGIEVDKVTAEYGRNRVNYQLEFGWGVDPKEAQREVQSIINGVSSGFPREIRDSVGVNFWSRSSGFIAITFYSPEKSLEELYKVLEPVIVPRLATVDEADNPGLWNPSRKEIIIEPRPEIMASLGIFPRDIEQALERGLEGYGGGTLQVGNAALQIQMPRQLNSLKELGNLMVTTPRGRNVHLSEVAHLDIAEAVESNQVFKTDSTKSIILFASPRSGANVKAMAEKIIAIVEESMEVLPHDIQYRMIVDPSEFIRSSIRNVIREVILAATIASLVLFIFIGSFRNTVTAALEIPFSMVLAFILMYIFEMNLNLISLGGLALAAGMNVDAAVVVMENIFRHMKNAGENLSTQKRAEIVAQAVREVRLPIIASTLSTLVVFAPLVFTQSLTNAILGDLAKAVVFSHSFSLLVALFIVPTVRLSFFNRSRAEAQDLPESPLVRQLKWLEDFYQKVLQFFFANKRARNLFLIGLPLIGLLFLVIVTPRLEKEIIGKPDTDWVIVGINTNGHTSIAQMETVASEVESRVMDEFRSDVLYTFNQVQRPNNASLMLRLKNKRHMEKVIGRLESFLQNSPEVFYWVVSWNPAELPIPEFSDAKVVIRGGSLADRTLVGEDLMNVLRETDIYSRFSSTPGLNRLEQINIVPHTERWIYLNQQGSRFLPYDLLDLVRVATVGKPYRSIPLLDEDLSVTIRYPQNEISSVEELEALPLMVGGKVIPLKSIADIMIQRELPPLYKENGTELIKIEGSQNRDQRTNMASRAQRLETLVRDYFSSNFMERLELQTRPIVSVEDPREELTAAMNQTTVALLISLILIFLTLLFQFTSIAHTAIIMSAVPFAVVGGVFSLFVFQSPLSLNAALGIILLNGIAVNNSIMLVDFIRRYRQAGLDVQGAIIEASRSRLRPILITTLTTVLGMLPIALGQGDGGKILQPLGVAVSGGLWFSMIFTLIYVPLLESIYLSRQKPLTSHADNGAYQDQESTQSGANQEESVFQ